MVQYFPDLVMPKNTYIVMVEAKAFLWMPFELIPQI
jgi:hypothetical protein